MNVPGHGVDLSVPHWEPGTGALQLACVCGFRVRDFPPNPRWYDSRLANMEADQVRRMRQHLEEVTRK